MLVGIGENYKLEKFDLKENSKYEYNEFPTITFYGKPANKIDIKKYRLQSGVDAEEDGVYIVSSNLPKNLKSGDKIRFLGRMWTVQSIGIYFDSSYLVNSRLFSNDYILEHCPKGFVLG